MEVLRKREKKTNVLSLTNSIMKLNRVRKLLTQSNFSKLKAQKENTIEESNIDHLLNNSFATPILDIRPPSESKKIFSKY